MAVPLRWGVAGVLLGVAASSCRNEPRAGTATPTPSARVSAAAEDVASRQARARGGRSPVIWLGLDALDFELVDRLAAEGKMPNWRRFEAEGYTARLTSYMPILSPIVWTTLATGVTPDVHRVLDFQEFDPQGGLRVPISGRSRAVPAVWSVASANGLRVGVVGWWATHPAEKVNGFFVSDRLSPILFEGLPTEGVVYPESLRAGLEQVVASESVVTDEDLARFVAMPLADIVKEKKTAVGLSDPITALARTIGATRVEARIARELYDRNLPDLMMLYFEGTDVIGHLFAPYVPPKMDCVSVEDFQRFGPAVDAYFGLVDRILGQWMRRAEEDGATLIVTSDHGFKWGKDRSCEVGSLNAATAGFWHRLDGVFAAFGPTVRKGVERGHASVYDVEPTIAALLGLPVVPDARGTPVRAFVGALPSPVHKDLAAEVRVQRLEMQPLSEAAASEYAKKLVALGYLSGHETGNLSAPDGARPGMTEGAWNNLGLYYIALHDPKLTPLAEEAFEKAIAIRADYPSPRLGLAVIYRTRGDDAKAIDEFFRAVGAGLDDREGAILDWSLWYEKKSKPARSREILERGARVFPDSETMARALGVSDYQAHECAKADAELGRFENTTASPETLNALALVRTCLGKREEAVRLFRRSLVIRPDQDTVVRSLALLEGGAAPGERKGS